MRIGAKASERRLGDKLVAAATAWTRHTKEHRRRVSCDDQVHRVEKNDDCSRAALGKHRHPCVKGTFLRGGLIKKVLVLLGGVGRELPEIPPGRLRVRHRDRATRARPGARLRALGSDDVLNRDQCCIRARGPKTQWLCGR
eukprot:Amastigsp_a844558_36.p5 type:complete len:141 gc:universal Amastigsp_a844558_36:1514-1092(-)